MNRQEAISYISINNNGYLSELIEAIGSSNVKALSLTGFISRGKEISNRDSWKATKLSKRLHNSLNPKVSFLDKVRYYINSKII